VEWCPACQGLWFDRGELRRLLDLHPNVFNKDNVRPAMAVIGVFLFPFELFDPLGADDVGGAGEFFDV
jgi:hypothetical protein